MLIDIFKIIFILSSCILTAIILLNKFLNKYISLKSTLLTIFLPITFSLILHYIMEDLQYIIPLLLVWFFVSSFTHRPQISFLIVITSFYLSYCLFLLTLLLLALPFSIFFYKTTQPPYLVFTIVSGLIHFIPLLQLLNNKRLINGLYKIYSRKYINIITVLYVISLIFIVPFPHLITATNKLIQLTLFIVFLILIIYTWQSAITKSYKESLRQREIDSLQTELNEKNKLIAKLSKQNEALGTLTHRDNKLIPTMEYAVSQYLLSDLSDPISAKEKGNILLKEIKELSSFRQNILNEISDTISENYDTGISFLDELLRYMKHRARLNKTIFNVFIPEKLDSYVPNIVQGEHITQLLSDLLENAIIATKGCETPIIQLQIYQSNKYLVIEVSDNGPAFEMETLLTLGLTPATTHSQDGGSGIGYMDIWRTKSLYRASLHIMEYSLATPFTKKIQLVFDKKNNYLISTYRKTDLEKISNRIDLQIL